MARRDVSDTDELPQILWYVAGQRYVRTAILYVTRSGARNQCKLTSASVMWSERRSRNIRRAAAFLTDWRRR